MWDTTAPQKSVRANTAKESEMRKALGMGGRLHVSTPLAVGTLYVIVGGINGCDDVGRGLTYCNPVPWRLFILKWNDLSPVVYDMFRIYLSFETAESVTKTERSSLSENWRLGTGPKIWFAMAHTHQPHLFTMPFTYKKIKWIISILVFNQNFLFEVHIQKNSHT